MSTRKMILTKLLKNNTMKRRFQSQKMVYKELLSECAFGSSLQDFGVRFFEKNFVK